MKGSVKHTLKLLKGIGLLSLLILASCQRETAKEDYYDEAFRPQFHFSPEANWMNDPNGMVYYDGEYHLFYQYYPDSTVWGPMHWGHAVSKNLVNWEHLPIALYPDSLGYIFSGSAVVDTKNTTGFGSEKKPALVAIFTYHDPIKEKAGATDYQYQGIAYSTDKGRTWTKYEGNPVLPNQGIKDFRDPKVFWHEASNQWVMTLAVLDHIEFYGSPNLKEWGLLGEFGRNEGAHGGVWECPDLFTLTDENGEQKWILLVSINPGGPNGGSATQYFVGNFNGEEFTSESGYKWLDHGSDNYAGVTWSNVPDGRRLFLGWMSNWDYGMVVPTETWRSAMTIPRELGLKNTTSGWVVTAKPVDEYYSLLENEQVISQQLYFGFSHLTQYIKTPQYLLDFRFIRTERGQDWSIDLYNHLDEHVILSYDMIAKVFTIDRSNTRLSGFSEKFQRTHVGQFESTTDNMKVQVWVDASCVELFVNDGEFVMTDIYFSSNPLNQVKFDTKEEALLVEGRIASVKSIW